MVSRRQEEDDGRLLYAGKGHQPAQCPSRQATRLLLVVVDDGLGVLVERLEAVPQRRRLVVRAVDQRLARELFNVVFRLFEKKNGTEGMSRCVFFDAIIV